MPFTLGQRWISDTESELGLGTVVAVDARTVTLLFPSTGENRLYARSDSPVTRVMFNPGDTITSHDGWQMQVEEVKEEKQFFKVAIIVTIIIIALIYVVFNYM